MPPPPLRLPSVPLPYPEPSPRGRRPSSSSLHLARSRSADDGSLGSGLSARRAGLSPMTPVGRTPRPADEDAKSALPGSAVWGVGEPEGEGQAGQAEGRTEGRNEGRTEGRSDDPGLSPGLTVWTGTPVTTVTAPSPLSPAATYGHERRASMLSTFSYHAPSPRASSDIEMVRKSTDSAASERQVLFAGESFDAEDGVCEEAGVFEPPVQRELLAIVVSVGVLVVLSLAAGLTTVYDWVL